MDRLKGKVAIITGAAGGICHNCLLYTSDAADD